ncbi:hypothetical protein LSM04_009545 [Trypanosoma melophagium]|uniref:uncharacterized protein n=1 Tax=Trypanosoma melophagium TaxID=715481 RepID=UPI00351A43F6|nr:hypothetical protein LSM04_009545 [Trypanosoma melophagium]
MHLDENCSGAITGCGASMSDSNPNLFPYPGLAPVITLTPTVGTRVVLTSRQCDRDAFIWEDKEIDLAYMRCAEQHMLVGKVLRETDTHFVVRFEIPYCCLPPNLCGQRVPRDPVSTRRCEKEKEKEAKEGREREKAATEMTMRRKMMMMMN